MNYVVGHEFSYMVVYKDQGDDLPKQERQMSYHRDATDFGRWMRAQPNVKSVMIIESKPLEYAYIHDQP